MTHSRLNSISFRTWLVLDAMTCVLMGAALCLGHELLAPLLGVPADFLFWAGVILFPCALLMILAAIPANTPVFLALIVVVGNVGWVVASFVAGFLVLSPNALGMGFIGAQAVAVGVIALMEYQAFPRGARADGADEGEYA